MAFLGERLELARSRGVAEEQLIVDPGPDFAKTPAQTIELLRGAARLHEFGRPVLMALSRKDFVGALTGRPPRERGAGTLAALAYGIELGAHIFRVHDVAAAADFLDRPRERCAASSRSRRSWRCRTSCAGNRRTTSYSREATGAGG